MHKPCCTNATKMRNFIKNEYIFKSTVNCQRAQLFMWNIQQFIFTYPDAFWEKLGPLLFRSKPDVGVIVLFSDAIKKFPQFKKICFFSPKYKYIYSSFCSEVQSF